MALQSQVATAVRAEPSRIMEDATLNALDSFLEGRSIGADRRAHLGAVLSHQLSAAVHVAPPTPCAPVPPVDLPASVDFEAETLLPFLVHWSTKTRFSRLHRRDGCWRRPGRELKEVTYYASISDAPFMDWCKDCWPNSVPVADAPGRLSDSSDADSSSSEGSG